MRGHYYYFFKVEGNILSWHMEHHHLPPLKNGVLWLLKNGVLCSFVAVQNFFIHLPYIFVSQTVGRKLVFPCSNFEEQRRSIRLRHKEI